ncbi:MAG TPA: hypothetical protein VEQ60_25790 [Longimicrobium sp.]|nr:hypothetical protein [Longimicrobium sp.]
MLLSVYPWGHEGFGFDPIAILTPDGPRNPDEVADSTFIRRYYRLGTRYQVRVDGVPAGEAAVVKSRPSPCMERVSYADVTLTSALPEQWHGMASDVFRAAPARPLMRPATQAEQGMLGLLGDSILAARGVPPDQRATAQRSAMFAVTVAGFEGPVLVGTFTVPMRGRKSLNAYTMMLVAERRGGRYGPTFVFFAREGRGVAARSFWDAADLDGDGVPELVMRASATSGWWGYTILKRGTDGWAEIYQGGGYTC